MKYIFKEDLIFKDKKIPRIILGSAPFTSEGYFGHRTRLYDLDLHRNPENVAKIIKKSYDDGVTAINLTTDKSLIEAFKIAISEGVAMKAIGTVGKTEIDYINPDYEKAKQANWKKDIKILTEFESPVMLVDEFITDSYDFDLLKEILTEIKSVNAIAGLVTAYPFKTTKILIDSPIKDLFDFYMIPINKLGYMMDSQLFMDKERKELADLLKKLDKKIIVNKILACGIQAPEEAFNFLKTLDYIDMVAVGIANEKEAETTFQVLKNI